jgi:hypothetical protein
MLAKGLGALIAAAVIAAPPTAQARHGYVITTVEAKQSWHKTRLRLVGHGTLRFSARGKWIFNPSQPAVGGAGAENLSTAGRASYTFSGREGREGQLIAKIGHGAPFVAGADGVHKIKRGEVGPLSLMINDDYKQSAGAGLADNSGHLRVRIDYRTK